MGKDLLGSDDVMPYAAISSSGLRQPIRQDPLSASPPASNVRYDSVVTGASWYDPRVMDSFFSLLHGNSPLCAATRRYKLLKRDRGTMETMVERSARTSTDRFGKRLIPLWTGDHLGH